MALPGAVVHIRKMRCSIMCSLAKDIGIDLGTASVLVYVKGKGVVLNEPSVVAINKDDGRLLSVGADAQAMLGRTPGNIVAIRPLREGVISDYDMTERMLKEFIRKVSGSFHHIFKPRVIICVPSGITEVEERAVVDAGLQSGASHVYLIEEPVAAAIGAGIDITKPEGHMVVDIGGGTSDIAVISLKGVVESASIKVAGDQFNEAIVKYMRRKHNILIGERTAEQMKMQIGCVFPKEEETTIEIKGRCLMTGLPKTITVTSTEMLEAFEEPVERILEAIHGVLERTPPELVADIANNGIVMTGGEQQRVAIARALVNNPSNIVADEPTGNLDPARSLEIMTLLERINALGTTVVVVTHEKSLVNHFDKRVIMIDHGVVAATGVGRYEVAAHA